MTQWSTFSQYRINFSLWHKLSPCIQQRLLQVYGKMFTLITDGIVVENFILYDFNLISLGLCLLFCLWCFYTLDVIGVSFILFSFVLFFHFISFHSIHSITPWCYGWLILRSCAVISLLSLAGGIANSYSDCVNVTDVMVARVRCY